MNALTGPIPENTAGGIGEGRQLAVSKSESEVEHTQRDTENQMERGRV